MDDYLLRAAVLYTLSSASQTSASLDEYLHNASHADADLDPLTYEIFDLRAPLERLGDSELVIPRQLQQPVLAIVRASGDALARIGSLLDDCAARGVSALQWDAIRPRVQSVKTGLRTCRRILQLAIEVVNLASARNDDATDIETLGTYLDQDTSRVLALIRRSLQHFQNSDPKDESLQSLQVALDDIRLYVQGTCRGKDDMSMLTAPTAGQRPGLQTPDLQEYVMGLFDVPSRSRRMVDGYRGADLVFSLRESWPQPPYASSDTDTHVSRASSIRPAKKLTNAIARWSFASTRKSNVSTPTSTPASATRPSSEMSSTRIPEDDTLSVASSPVQTSRQASYRSRDSFTSSLSSWGSRNVARAASPPSSSSMPPILPSRNPRRSAFLSSINDSPLKAGSQGLPDPPTPSAADFPLPPGICDGAAISGPTASYPSQGVAADKTDRLPTFAVSPADKIFIDPADIPMIWRHHGGVDSSMNLSRTHLYSYREKGDGRASTAYHLDASPSSSVIASKHGDKTIRIYSLPQGAVQTSIKVNFYINMQERSRDFFVTSHAILSESKSLLLAATGFGHTLEVWDWVRKKKVQTLESVYRWAMPKAAPSSLPAPLACYREHEDAIYLYPMAPDADNNNNNSRKPLDDDRPAVIRLADAGLPYVPKLPELAISSTNPPLLVAAAGPRPPRPGHPPPAHSAMLMFWNLSPDPSKQSPLAHKMALPMHHAVGLGLDLDLALPCGLAVHGSAVVSLWIPASVRVVRSSAGANAPWRVEPSPAAARRERLVLAWDLETGRTSAFGIPNEDTVACISPDCRFVAYRQGPGAADAGRRGARDVSLVIVDALRGGRELWRTPAAGGGLGPGLSAKGCDQLMDLSRVTSVAFSGEGNLLLVGDAGGSVGVYEVRTGGGEDGRVDVVPR